MSLKDKNPEYQKAIRIVSATMIWMFFTAVAYGWFATWNAFFHGDWHLGNWQTLFVYLVSFLIAVLVIEACRQYHEHN